MSGRLMSVRLKERMNGDREQEAYISKLPWSKCGLIECGLDSNSARWFKQVLPASKEQVILGKECHSRVQPAFMNTHPHLRGGLDCGVFLPLQSKVTTDWGQEPTRSKNGGIIHMLTCRVSRSLKGHRDKEASETPHFCPTFSSCSRVNVSPQVLSEHLVVSSWCYSWRL